MTLLQNGLGAKRIITKHKTKFLYMYYQKLNGIRYKSDSMASTIKRKSAWSELSGKTEKKIYFKQPKLNEKIIKIKYLLFIIII